VGSGGYRLRVNSTPDAVEFVADTFLNLSDTPSTFSGYPSAYLKVNSGANAVEFVTDDTFHEGTVGEIKGLSNKATIVDDDVFLIEDSAASWAKKYTTAANIATYIGSGLTDAAAIHDDTAQEIQPITTKSTPVDADVLLIEDSAASWAKKSVAFSNLSSYVESDLGGPFLPLTAGSGESLTGDLYVHTGLNPGIVLREGGTANYYIQIYDDGAGSSYIYAGAETAGTAATLNINPYPTSTGAAYLNIFPQVTTSSTVAMRVYNGGGAVAHTFGGSSGDADLCQQGGQVTIGGTGGAEKLTIVGGNIRLDYTYGLYCENSVGTAYKIASMASGNVVTFGTDTYTTDIRGSGTRPTYKGSSLALYSDIGGGTDPDAIHDNVANEITAITEKTSLADNDEFVIEDSAASYVKKSVKLSNLQTYVGADYLPLTGGTLSGDTIIDGGSFGDANLRLEGVLQLDDYVWGAQVFKGVGGVLSFTDNTAGALKLQLGTFSQTRQYDFIIRGYHHYATKNMGPWEIHCSLRIATTPDITDLVAEVTAGSPPFDVVSAGNDGSGNEVVVFGTTSDVMGYFGKIHILDFASGGNPNTTEASTWTMSRITSTSGYTFYESSIPIYRPHDAQRMWVYNNSGGAIAAGDLCYISGYSTYPTIALADADAVSTSSGMLVCAYAAMSNGTTGWVITRGKMSGFSSLTAGNILYVSTTAGDFTATAPTGTNDVVRVAAYALSTTEIFFDPSKTWVERT